MCDWRRGNFNPAYTPKCSFRRATFLGVPVTHCSFVRLSVFLDRWLTVACVVQRSGWMRFLNVMSISFSFYSSLMLRCSSVITAAAATRKSLRCHVWPACRPVLLALAKCVTATGSVSSARRRFSLRSSTSSAPKSKVQPTTSIEHNARRNDLKSNLCRVYRRTSLRSRPSHRRQHGTDRLLPARPPRRRRGAPLRRPAGRPLTPLIALPPHNGPHLARYNNFFHESIIHCPCIYVNGPGYRSWNSVYH